MSDKSKVYKDWGNNVFSLAIPIPSHRIGYENICIEMYYTDDELMTQDANGRRLFLTSEFKEISGTYISDPTIHIGNSGKLKGLAAPQKAKIVDAEVYKDDVNIALSKSAFVGNIYSGVPPFDKFGFEEFSKIFEIIAAIIKVSSPKLYISFPRLAEFTTRLQSSGSIPQKLSNVFEEILNLIEMALELFSACTVRVYDETIVRQPAEYTKKVRPIRTVIREKFTNPQLPTVYELARHCFYLVRDDAPVELLRMKQCLESSVTLGSVGALLDDLETIFPPEEMTARIINRPETINSPFDHFGSEFANYPSRRYPCRHSR